MRSEFRLSLAIAIFSTIAIVHVSGSNFLYGMRIPGSLPTYNDRLKIDGQPVEHWRYNKGDRVVLKCITGLEDYPIFVWRKDGRPLPREIIKYQLISNGNSFLEIPSVSLKNEGNYTCSVNNEFGVAKKEYKLCVIARGVKEDCSGWWYNWSN